MIINKSLKEECGICGVYGHSEASNLVYLGLYALQHRGQESAGIASSDSKSIHLHRQMGLVADIFNEQLFKKLSGNIAIGHVRYSTTGSSLLKNAQPFVVDYAKGSVAVAHNGNLTNAHIIREELERRGAIFQSTTDTEVIVHLLAISKMESFPDRVIDALSMISGAYSLLISTESELIAARDPYGFRPLVFGKLKEAYIFSSETCALDLLEADFIRDVEPGEVILIDKNGPQFFMPFKQRERALCIFEFIYFSRPDSYLDGINVYMARKELGRQLAIEHPVGADIVIPVPDSGIPAAIGYSQESNIPFETGLIRNHYVGRTFIEPRQSIRHFGVKIKLNPVRSIIKGKRVVVIDDSIVRGTTSRKIIKMVRDAGAKEVHMRISSPPIKCPCFYGIDTPTRRELIASSHDVEEINKFITSNSLNYLSIKGMMKAIGFRENEFCVACFTGKYPIKFPRNLKNSQLPLFNS